MGVQSFRLEFTNENEATMTQAIHAYQTALQTGKLIPTGLPSTRTQMITQGHYHRGVCRRKKIP